MRTLTDVLIARATGNQQAADPVAYRAVCGRAAGWLGVTVNLCLLVVKLIAGWLSASVSVVADAFNNLSDAGSSLVMLVGFRLSAVPPDKEHPFGHGRMEYLAALAVATLIVAAGVELLRSAVGRILAPEPTVFSWVSAAILTAAIAVKGWLMAAYRRINKTMDSKALAAAAADSRSDMLCTAVVLIATVAGGLSGVPIDGYIGAAVALFVVWSGVSVIRDAVSPLLGQAPEPEYVEGIRNAVLAHEGVLGIHDLMVHSYGPARRVLSMHIEIPSHTTLTAAHTLADVIEQEIAQKFHTIACIHVDPVDTEDNRVTVLHLLTNAVVEDVDDSLRLHDFRVDFGQEQTTVTFDLVTPFAYARADEAVALIREKLRAVDPQLQVNMTVEHTYC